jgi:hypothetical protein
MPSVPLNVLLMPPPPVTDAEKLLVDVGAVRANDSRLQRNKPQDANASSSKIRQGRLGGTDDDDSDWD